MEAVVGGSGPEVVGEAGGSVVEAVAVGEAVGGVVSGGDVAKMENNLFQNNWCSELTVCSNFARCTGCN